MSDIQLQLVDRFNSFSLKDTLATFAPGTPAFTDSIALSEVVALIGTGAIDVPLEGIALTDTKAIALGWRAILADSYSLDDTFDNYIVGIVLTLSDTIALADSTNFEGSGISLPFSDSIALSDALKAVTGVNAAFTENLAIVDTLETSAPDSLGFTDSLVLSDAVTVDNGTGEIAISMTNTITFSDSLRLTLGSEISKSDTLSLLDIETALERGILTFADQLALSDILQVKAPITGFEVHDSLLFTEALTLKYGNRIDPGDTIAFSDAVLLSLIGVAPSVSDFYTLSDAVAVRLNTANLTFAEALTLTDAVLIRLATQLRVTSSDTLILSDSLSTTTYTDFIDYIRRYLNDVACDSNVGS